MSAEKNKDLSPPRMPEWIVRRLAWGEDRSAILENLREEYMYVCEARGERSADLWYWGHMMRTLFPCVRFQLYWRFAMLKNYLKLVLRGIQKYKGYSIINIAGLAVGLACFILISLWINFEIGYDRFHENCENLYQVFSEIQYPNGDIRYFTNTPGALAHALQMERSEIRHVSRLVDRLEIMLGTQEKRFLEKIRFVDPAFSEMFSFEFLKGNPESAFSQPYSIILTEDMARKYFGKDDPLGKEILFGSDMSLLVTGVIKEIPENSFLSSISLVHIAVAKELGWDIDRWGGGNYDTYIQLEKHIDHEAFITQIRNFYEKHAENWVPSKLSIRPITKIHLYALNGGGSIVYVYIFSGMTLFILLLAMVNFVNLSTALSVRRAKEIGIRKVVGAYRRNLASQILMESVLITLLSGGLAFIIAYALLPALNQLTDAHIAFSFSVTVILSIVGIVILTGLISGIYPAFILSRLQPVRAVKGGISPGKNSLIFRKVLIGFQFSLSIFMIIAMFGVNKQLKYLNTKDLGYNRDNIISLGLAREISSQFPVMRTELLRNPEIVSLTRSSSRMDKAYTTTGDDAVTWEGKSTEKQMPQTHLMRVDPEFLETFKIDIVDGRFFSHEFPHDRTESVVINETALRTMELKSPIGKRISVWGRNFRIIGVVKDFHFYSLHKEIQPLIFINRYAGFKEIFVRINSQNLV
ncbi:MAG: ABC transporter permease, partial [Candidatus Aminicenantes bacterium]